MYNILSLSLPFFFFIVMMVRIKQLFKLSTVVTKIPVIDENDEKQFYRDAIHRLIRKLDLRLLPFLLLLELSSFINRVNIGMCFPS